METATIFATARKHGVKAAAFHLISDQPFEAAKDAALDKRVKTEFAPDHLRHAIRVLQHCAKCLVKSHSADAAEHYEDSRCREEMKMIVKEIICELE